MLFNSVAILSERRYNMYQYGRMILSINMNFKGTRRKHEFIGVVGKAEAV